MALQLNGDGTITGLAEGGLENAKIINADIKDDTIAEEKLDISNSASDGQFLQYENSSNKLTWATVASPGGATGLDVNDDVKVRFGTDNDFEIYHDGDKTIFDGDLITTPKQPVCIVTTSSNPSISSGEHTYPMNEISYERHQGSSNYDTSNYRFTCPVAGAYLIDCTLNVYGFNNDNMRLSVKKNGSSNYQMTRTKWHIDEENIHGSTILNASANDYFEILTNSSDSGTGSGGMVWTRCTYALLG